METQARQNKIVFYVKVLLSVILALLLRTVMLAPLGALIAFPAGSFLRFLALLTPVLLVFIVLPLRFSFAQALIEGKSRNAFSLKEAFSFSRYGSKLGLGMVHGLKLLLWGIPTLAVVGYAAYLYFFGKNFAFLQFLPQLGSFALTVIYAVWNFFAGLFGQGTLTVPKNTMAEGIVVFGAILLLTLLFWLWGAVRNSAFRYLWALSERNGTTLEKEKRIHLMGRRGEQFGTAMVNLLLCVPFFGVMAWIMKDFMSKITVNLQMVLMTGALPVAELSKAALPLILDFVLLYLTILPIRRMRTARFAGTDRSALSKKASEL